MVDLDAANGQPAHARTADAEGATAGHSAPGDGVGPRATARHVDAGEGVGVVVYVHVDEPAWAAALDRPLLLARACAANVAAGPAIPICQHDAADDDSTAIRGIRLNLRL